MSRFLLRMITLCFGFALMLGNTQAANIDLPESNQPKEGIYLAPRAPTDTWNLWHESHIDPLFDRLIEGMVAVEDVSWNRVYVMGYSAGGDHHQVALIDSDIAASKLGKKGAPQ